MPQPDDSFPLSSEWVTLKGGVELPLSAIRLALALHDAGWGIRRQGDRLMVTPERNKNATLPDLLRSAVSEHKAHLLVVCDAIDTLDVVVPDPEG